MAFQSNQRVVDNLVCYISDLESQIEEYETVISKLEDTIVDLEKQLETKE